MDTETKTPFAARMAREFKKEGQKMAEFANEMKALTPKDKDDFCRWFNEAGMPTDVPMVPGVVKAN